MSKEVKRYAERDAYELDKAGNYYCRHVSAMTGEGLHSKSDIAAELGWRDMQIDALLAERDALKAEVESLGNELLETEARALKFFHRFSAATDLGRELREALERIAKNEVEEDDCLVPMSSEQCMQVAYDALEPFRKHAALQGEQP
jgi:hypothetical protein